MRRAFYAKSISSIETSLKRAISHPRNSMIECLAERTRPVAAGGGTVPMPLFFLRRLEVVTAELLNLRARIAALEAAQ
jgi:hypothetical protein